MSKDRRPPAITNYMPISVRAFAKPKVDKTKKIEPTKKPKRKTSLLPASPWVIILDTETTTDPSQHLRFGTYQVRCDGELSEAGIFYDPDAVSGLEVETLQQYVTKHELKLITRDEFADRVFYGIGYALRAAFVGFNLPFDIARIPVPAEKLKSFKEALAGYHMQHENKFLNGSFRDQGTTKRRHVMRQILSTRLAEMILVTSRKIYDLCGHVRR